MRSMTHGRARTILPRSQHHPLSSPSPGNASAASQGANPVAEEKKWPRDGPGSVWRCRNPKSPVLQEHGDSQWCPPPQREKRRPKGAATITTDNSVSGGFRPAQHHACRTLSAMPVARSPSHPHRLYQENPGHSPRHHHGATSMHPPAPSPTTKAAPD
ncbi:hypothetical protein C2845_PM10G22060 [Panicum miliaceum]|uniref:Uncharacterized protein n=1 Tax=Panicum miliaceum TaxID=4540 RepID=A0A3L6PCV2_PANMI|nr:hypothetical protein C2845_PM10G22060 [Panicum miliaceum]